MFFGRHVVGWVTLVDKIVVVGASIVVFVERVLARIAGGPIGVDNIEWKVLDL